MPLKHRTETAYILLLGFAMCLTGVVLGRLPSLSRDTVTPWFVVLALASVYPLSLYTTFRANRADYEFRALHWYPAAMTALWALLQAPLSRYPSLQFLFDGAFFLSSLPMVALGILLLSLFSLQVLRRWTIRVASLGCVFALFVATALGAELAPGFRAHRDALQRTVGVARHVGVALYDAGSHIIASLRDRDDAPAIPSSPSPQASRSSVSSTLDYLQAHTSSTPFIDKRTPTRLAGTGPAESFGALLLCVIATYSAVLHSRAKRRSS